MAVGRMSCGEFAPDNVNSDLKAHRQDQPNHRPLVLAVEHERAHYHNAANAVDHLPIIAARFEGPVKEREGSRPLVVLGNVFAN